MEPYIMALETKSIDPKAESRIFVLLNMHLPHVPLMQGFVPYVRTNAPSVAPKEPESLATQFNRDGVVHVAVLVVPVEELRILFKLNVDERRVRDAQKLGQVYPYLYELACTNTLLYHPWLSSCQIGKYHINKFSDQTAIVLVDSETSTVADEELALIHDEDQKLLTIANRLNSYIVGLEAAVDIPRDKKGASGNFDFNHEGIPQIRSVLTYCVEVQEVGNVALSRDNFDSLKHTLAKQLQSQLKCAARETTRIVNVIPRRVLDFEDRLAVSAITHFHTRFHPADTGFPEQWKMGLQGVIDSLGVNKGLGINFQLPVYGDLELELGMYVPNYERHVDISDPRSIECKMLDSVFELLKLMSYDCYPSEHFVARDGADLYATALVQMSISSISVHLGGKEYSDLVFLELLSRKCKWASFSVFTFSGVASYLVVVQMFTTFPLDPKPSHLWEINTLARRTGLEHSLISELDSVFELLKLMSYDCYPSEHFVARDGADLYATALVQMSISSISVHLGGKEYSDLVFLELLSRKCKWASFSVFTFPEVASYLTTATGNPILFDQMPDAGTRASWE
ncbi:hypothetical protein CRM22_007355 [Opisthorchis felineus]|uniref:Uncharacterized protein n=1 Tax=Opisthorchis felineus TaxID=147828 RepID=A0A4S2LGI8_OPIFE|nr:hypothetical protein CRM22_007355 [Opisthorchis felineus]